MMTAMREQMARANRHSDGDQSFLQGGMISIEDEREGLYDIGAHLGYLHSSFVMA